MVNRELLPDPALPLDADLDLAPPPRALVDARVILLAALAVALGGAAGLIAQLLQALIGLVTNLAFYGRVAFDFVSPAQNALGPWVVGVPVLGGLVVGLMARYGSKAIRGHGIPEAMEQVLTNESRIPLRMTFLKPLSAAIAIGTGGPFGAEGPIIATGGALGSGIGQFLHVTADERKILLASGAAAGMAATFGSPVSAVLLAIELLLFEYRARSVIPVALAACAATAVRIALVGADPVFAMSPVAAPTSAALAVYIALGALVGVASVWVTRAVYAVEDAFEKLPIHWMWWPALGGAAVGLIGWLVPSTLGVGYGNIADVLNGDLAVGTLVVLCVAKLVSWTIALGSGTSGGTLAPLFTIGGASGALLALGAAWIAPAAGIDPRVGALVGMAAMFAGASRALLASVVFAFETTQQPMGLLPLLGGCSAAYFVSCLAMPNTIMTEKLARRGLRVTSEYAADHLETIRVNARMTRAVVSFEADSTLGGARTRLRTEPRHQAFPVVSAQGALIGVVTRGELLDPQGADEARVRSLLRRGPVVVHPEHTLREAADHMLRCGVGRVVVVERAQPRQAVGMLTRSDLLDGHGLRLSARDERRTTRGPLRSL